MEVKGLSLSSIEEISKIKQESAEILSFRKKAYRAFEKLPFPSFGPSFSIDFDSITYYKSSLTPVVNDWRQISSPIQSELERVGVMEAETHMDGIGVQYESEVIYHNMIRELEEKKIIFLGGKKGML